MSASVYEMF